MTLPANFPGRRDARRVGALRRIEAMLAASSLSGKPLPSKLTRAENIALADRIALKLNANARDIRTKKGARR